MSSTSFLLVFLVVLNVSLCAKDPEKVGSTDELFGFSKVGRVLLTLSPEDWKAIKPDEPARPGGPGGFGPGTFLAQSLLRQFDADKNDELSREEFTEGFDHWFRAWDTKQMGSLDGDTMCDGMNKDLNPMAGGGPGGGSGGPGGPRPPGGGGGPGGPPGFQAREGKRNGLSGMSGLEFKYVHADLEIAGRQFADVAVRYKGNGTYMESRNTERKSLKVELNEFIKGQKLFGMTKLNLHSNITDTAWMKESLAYELYREAGVPAPRSSYTRLAVTVPGTFDRHSLGLYTLVENPDENWAKFNFGSKKGLILKPVTRELFIDKGPEWKAYKQAYDAKTDITDEQVNRVVDFAKLVTSASDEDFSARLTEYLDVDEFSRFMAVTVWLSSTDSILMTAQNYVVYLHPKTNKFLFVPWDLDRAFGNFFVPQPEELSMRKAWSDDIRFLNRVMQAPVVREAYLARLAEFQGTLFQPQRLNKRIDEMAQLIRPAVAEQGGEALTRFDRALVEEEAAEVPPTDQGARPPGFPMQWGRPIKIFIKARHQSIADQLAGNAEGRELGGGGFGGPPGAPRAAANGGGPGPGGPGAPGGHGGGPGGQRFGIGNFLAPVFVKAADTDADGHVTPAEFQALAARWFDEWDTNGGAYLKAEQLRNGFAKVLPPPPGFGGPLPGGPGAPGVPVPPAAR